MENSSTLCAVGMALVLPQNDGGGSPLPLPCGLTVQLNEAERVRKLRMIAAFTSQCDTLEAFGVRDELYRPALHHDFPRPPNGGRVLYDRYDWGLTSPHFTRLARAPRAQLGLGGGSA